MSRSLLPCARRAGQIRPSTLPAGIRAVTFDLLALTSLTGQASSWMVVIHAGVVHMIAARARRYVLSYFLYWY
jgi:hypothetical protein